MSTPAYQYGAILGNMQAAFEEAAEQMAAGFRGAIERRRRARQMAALVQKFGDIPAVREAVSAIRYHQRIERERQIARDYLRDLVSATEQELGLRPEFAPERKKR